MKKQLLLEPKHLKSTREDFEVIGVFNPGVIKYGNEIIMIARVAEQVIQNDPDNFLVPLNITNKEIKVIKLPKKNFGYDYSDPRIIRNHHHNYLTSISHLRVGRSLDGINFEFLEDGYIFPDNIYEEYGMEDPRITQIEDKFYITYSAVSSCGINVGLIETKDFKSFTRLGNIFHSDNKDCVIFPEKINGKYYALHRPSTSQFGKLDIWTAESSNLTDWGNHRIILNARVSYVPSVRVGAGAVPILTEKGWLEIYHSGDINDIYHLTAMVLDKDNPNQILMKSVKPLVVPTEPYEKHGFLDNVVFTCGLIYKSKAEIIIYYGVCDQSIAAVTLSLQDIWDTMEMV